MEKEVFKKDELGIIPINEQERIVSDIKEMIINSDLSNEENKKRFDLMIKENPELLEIISEIAFISFVKKLANECEDFNTREYLIDKYELDSDSLSHSYIDGTDFYSLVREMVEKYIGIDKLVSKWSNYNGIIVEEVERLSSKKNELNNAGKDDTDEYDKLENRVDELSNINEGIADFVDDPDFYADGIIDKYIDKVDDYVIKNANEYVDSGKLLARVVNSIDDVSPDIKNIYVNAIMEYANKQKATSVTPLESDSEEIKENTGRRM